MRRRVLKAAAIGTASLMMIAPIRTIASDTAAETEAGEKPGFAFETPLTAGEPVELTVSTQWDLSADADESDREGFRILDESLLKVLLEVKDSTSLIADASWIYQEKEALRAQAEITPENIAFSLPGIDTNKYILPFDTLSGSDGSGLFDINVQAPDIPIEKFEGVFTPYAETMADFIDEHAQSTDGTIHMDLIHKTAEGTTCVWNPDGTQIKDLLGQIAGQIEQDDTLDELLNKIADGYEKLLERDAGADEDTIRTLRSFCPAAPEQLRTAGEGAVREYRQGTFVLTLAKDSEGKLCRADVLIGDPSGSSSSHEGGTEAGISSTYEVMYQNYDGAFSFEIADLDQVLGLLSIAYSENNKHYAGNFSLTIKGGSVADGEYDIDASTKSMFYVPYGHINIHMIGGITLSLSAEGETDGSDRYTFTLGGMEIPGFEWPVTGLTVELESKVAGSGPEAPAGTEVNYTAMTNEEKDELGSKIEQALQEFFEPYIIK